MTQEPLTNPAKPASADKPAPSPRSSAGAGRFALLDAARGLAAFAVVLFHDASFHLLPPGLKQYAQHGDLGVPVFFVISGYCVYAAADKLAERPGGAVEFLKRRFWRIYPTFWASLLFAMLIRIHFDQRVFTLKDWLANIALVHPYTHSPSPVTLYWTLVYEQQFYIIIGLIIFPFVRKFRTAIMVTGGIWAAARLWNLLPDNALTTWRFLPAWLEFSLGFGLYLILHKPQYRKWALPLFALMVSAAFTAQNSELARSSLGFRGNYYAAGMFVLFAAVMFQFDIRVTRQAWYRPLRWLGMISYSLYLTHQLGFRLMDAALAGRLAQGTWELYVAHLIGGFGFAVPFFYVFEKPFLNSLRKAKPALPQAVERTM